MQVPSPAKNEKRRIEKLNSLDILDTQAQERFDRLTRLARKMFNVPIALVSLVDENRQWFKSCFGLPVRETSRDVSFCGHAILGDDIFIINNALEDERFFDNPLVTGEPNIRFYAGVPLYFDELTKLGTLCIIDNKPRDFSKDDLASLKDLALLAQQELIASQLATLDELTQISNRRGFKLLAQKSLNICYREKISAVLVFIDIDKFKDINDKYGHKEGDEVLKVFSNTMEKTFRESDVFARIGGDEFVVLLTDTNLNNAKKIVNRFKKNINSFDKDYDIDFSSGILQIDINKEHDLKELLNKADSLMYKSKLQD